MIGVDGAHLKGNYGGVLLLVIAIDGNNEIFPVAWAIVGAKDTNSRKFFIWNLKNALKDSGRGDEWCIMSDGVTQSDFIIIYFSMYGCL